MSAQSWLTPFKVGLVVLAGILASIYMLTRVSQDFSKGEPTYLVHADFDDATGLAEKSQVRLAGIPVGEVQKIELINDRARVTMRLTKRVRLFEGEREGPSEGGGGVYRNGATVSKKTSSLLGDYYLELTPGVDTQSAKNPVIEDGGEVHMVLKAAGTEAILAEMEKITKDISQITGSLAATLGGEEGQKRLDSIVQDVNDTTAAIKRLIMDNASQIDKIVSNVNETTNEVRLATIETRRELAQAISETRRDLTGAMGNVRDITRNAKTVVNNAGQKFDLALDKLDAGLDRAVASIESLERSLKNVEQTTTDVKRISTDVADGKGSLGRMLTDDTLAKEAEGLVTDSRVLVQNTNKTIEQLDSLLGPAARLQIHINFRNDYMFEFDAFKNIIGLRLQPGPNKWYQLEVVRDPRGSTSTVRRVRDATGELPTYEEITETTSDLKFSVQFAGRYEWIVGRYGLIENTGGVGLNFLFFNDNLEFIADFFDFGFADYPRFRGVGILYTDAIIPYEWAQYTYLSGGIDDAFNEGTRDYFIGVGLSFTDADLKGILPFAPSP
jgi:phospholipid/cholesterol/gamma-HCH transport system substrate-binding protein